MEPQQSNKPDALKEYLANQKPVPEPHGPVNDDRLLAIEDRLAKLEAWARGYAGPLLYRGLEMGEKMEVNKKTPYDPPAGRDIPDLKLREL